MLWEFNKDEILEASPPTRHCRNSANFKFWWPISQPSTAGIQQIVNSHGQSDNPTLLEFNKFEIPVASQPAQHCSNSIHYKFWWPVSERNAEPEDMCERNAEPDEMCERNAEPEEMCERNAEPEEMWERSAEPEEMCERNGEPEEMCERNAEPEEMCERNAEPEETCERNAEPEEMWERSAEPEEMRERNAEPEEVWERSAEPEDLQQTGSIYICSHMCLHEGTAY
jgi:hypothetical protein